MSQVIETQSPAEDDAEPKFELRHRLSRALEVRKVSVQDIAGYMGVHRNTVSRWLAGTHRPSPSQLRDWSAGTGVSVAWLDPEGEVVKPQHRDGLRNTAFRVCRNRPAAKPRGSVRPTSRREPPMRGVAGPRYRS